MSAPLCPMCGAESPRSCDLEDECDGACPWIESGQYEDDDSLTGFDPDQDCGRWDQRAGGLAKSCRLAGSEDCEFCPYRGTAA